jgi:hypothetical protein
MIALQCKYHNNIELQRVSKLATDLSFSDIHFSKFLPSFDGQSIYLICHF